MPNKRTHIVIPEDLVAAIDTIAGKRGRSKFLVESAWREVRRLQQLRALEQAVGAWKIKDHPELKGGSAAWVRKLRRESEKRFRRVARRAS